MSSLRLPSAVYDDSLGYLTTRLARVEADEGIIELDFQDVTFLVPAALVTLLATVNRWHRSGRRVMFLNAETCPAFAYLQRMDFFVHSGLKLPESFVRHDAKGRFLPLCCLDAGDVAEISTRLAACVFPDQADTDDPEQSGAFDLIEYAASELINNVRQHARGTGYVAAQVYPKSGLVRVAVADSGIGIRQSFAETVPPFWDPAMTHLDAVRTALQPRTSSKTHLKSAWGEPVNAGVGLSMLRQIAPHADGLFTLLSGTGFYQHNHLEKRSLPTELVLAGQYQGTVCALQLSKEKLGNLQLLLQTAKREIGLLGQASRFDALFDEPPPQA